MGGSQLAPSQQNQAGSVVDTKHDPYKNLPAKIRQANQQYSQQ